MPFENIVSKMSYHNNNEITTVIFDFFQINNEFFLKFVYNGQFLFYLNKLCQKKKNYITPKNKQITSCSKKDISKEFIV